MMDTQLVVEALLQQAREKKLREGPQITIGELILLLGAVKDPYKSIIYKSGRSVGNGNSYRGYYDEYALSEMYPDSYGPDLNVGDVLKHLQYVVGTSFEGYKGGDYTMSRRTPLWKASWGKCGPMIIGIEETEDFVFVLTQEDPI